MFVLIIFLRLLLQPGPLYVVSPDFEDGGSMPVYCTCDGNNITPTIVTHGIPAGTKSLALIVEDPDSPLAAPWVAWNLPPSETLDERTLSTIKTKNSDDYRGPCPDGGSVQRYIFKVFALDTVLALPSYSGKLELEQAMRESVIATGQLTGEYSRTVVMSRKKRNR